MKRTSLCVISDRVAILTRTMVVNRKRISFCCRDDDFHSAISVKGRAVVRRRGKP